MDILKVVHRHYRKYSLERFIEKVTLLIVGYFVINQVVIHQVNPSLKMNLPVNTTPILWVIITVIFEFILVILAIEVYRRYQLKKAGMNEIDEMSGDQFEEKLCTLFQQLGYHVEHYSEKNRGHEYGVDIIIEKDGSRTAVQAKRFGKKQHVDNTAVEKLVAGKTMVNCDQALVVTNSTYTKNAQYAAHKLHVELWGRNELVSQLLRVQRI